MVPDIAAAVEELMVPMVAVANMKDGLVAKGKAQPRESLPNLPENYIRPEALSTNQMKLPQTPAMVEIMEALRQMDIRVHLASWWFAMQGGLRNGKINGTY